MFRWSVAQDLPAIGVPVLILTGDRDIVTLPSASQTIAERLPHATLSQLEGSGHMGFLENAERYNAAIAVFAEARFAAEAAPPGAVREPSS